MFLALIVKSSHPSLKRHNFGLRWCRIKAILVELGIHYSGTFLKIYIYTSWNSDFMKFSLASYLKHSMPDHSASVEFNSLTPRQKLAEILVLGCIQLSARKHRWRYCLETVCSGASFSQSWPAAVYFLIADISVRFSRSQPILLAPLSLPCRPSIPIFIFVTVILKNENIQLFLWKCALK